MLSKILDFPSAVIDTPVGKKLSVIGPASVSALCGVNIAATFLMLNPADEMMFIGCLGFIAALTAGQAVSEAKKRRAVRPAISWRKTPQLTS